VSYRKRKAILSWICCSDGTFRIEFNRSRVNPSMHLIRSMLWLCCFGVFVAAEALAQIAQPHTDKIDAVLILDASASMRLTDPEKLREEGARLFLQYLQKGDRLAILEFSGETNLIQPLLEFDSADIDSIHEKISQAGDDGIYADLYQAVGRGFEILTEDPRDDARSIMIVLSDGMMEPDPEQGTAQELTEKLFDNLVPELRQHDVVVHTLGFSDIVDPEFLRRLALATEGVNWFTTSSDDLHRSFAELFLVIKQPQVVPLTSKGFRVDSDVQEATFYINNQGAESIFLVSPDGERYHSRFIPGHMTWYQSSRFDVITISKPKQGMWEVLGLPEHDGFATVLTRLRLLTDWPSVIMAETPYLLQARLYEEDKPVVLPEMARATHYGFQIVPSDRVSEPLIREALRDDGTHGDRVAGDGIFAYEISIDEPGEYELRIVARGPTFERQQLLPFRVRPRMVSLEVESVDPDSSSVGDSFQVSLSRDALIYREIEVKLQAVDSSRRIYEIPLRATEQREDLFKAPARLLPSEGEYKIQASFRARDRRGKQISALSQELVYKTEHAVEDREVVQIIVPEESKVVAISTEEPAEEELEPRGPNPFLWGFIVLLTQGGLGFFYLKKLERSLKSSSINLNQLDVSPGYLEEIAKLEAKAAVTEVDLNDPAFQNLSGPRKKKVEEETSAEAASQAGPEKSEEVTTETEERTEDTPDDSEEKEASVTPEEAPSEESKEGEARADESVDSGGTEEDQAEKKDGEDQ